jgi:hypothetical protein
MLWKAPRHLWKDCHLGCRYVRMEDVFSEELERLGCELHRMATAGAGARTESWQQCSIRCVHASTHSCRRKTEWWLPQSAISHRPLVWRTITPFYFHVCEHGHCMGGMGGKLSLLPLCRAARGVPSYVAVPPATRQLNAQSTTAHSLQREQEPTAATLSSPDARRKSAQGVLHVRRCSCILPAALQDRVVRRTLQALARAISAALVAPRTRSSTPV